MDPGALEGAARFAGPLFTPGAELSQGVDYGCQWLVAWLAEQSPLVLAVDDAHWADAASLRVLLDVQSELSVQPVLLVLASRPVENPEAQRLLAAMAAQPDSCVLAPAPLSRRGVAELLGERFGSEPDAGLVDECARASGGNAFYLHELLRLYREDAASRRLGPWSRTALSRWSGPCSGGWASWVRMRPPWRMRPPSWATVAHSTSPPRWPDLDVTWLSSPAARLEAASILGSGDPVEFLHPLIRSAVEETLPQVSIGGLHARAARLLWSRGCLPTTWCSTSSRHPGQATSRSRSSSPSKASQRSTRVR